MQTDIDFGISLAQLGNRHGQHIACLCVRGGDGQCAAVFSAELLANAFEVAQLTHDQINTFENVLTRFGNTLQAFAMPCKDFNA